MRRAGRKPPQAAPTGMVLEAPRAGGASSVRADVARYDPVARTAHWTVVLLAILAVSLAWTMEGAPRNTQERELLFLLHRSIGLTILALMLFRALWRWRHPPPPLPDDVPRIMRAAAHCNHVALYLLFIAMPLAGYVNAAAGGHSVSYFGLFEIPPAISENERLAQFAVAAHLAGQYLVYLSVAVHVAAGLFHGIVRRDGVLARMLPRSGRPR